MMRSAIARNGEWQAAGDGRTLQAQFVAGVLAACLADAPCPVDRADHPNRRTVVERLETGFRQTTRCGCSDRVG